MEKTKGFEDFLKKVSKNTKIRYMGNRYYIVSKNADKQSSPTEYLDFFLLNTSNGPIIIEKSVAYEIKDRLNESEKLVQN